MKTLQVGVPDDTYAQLEVLAQEQGETPESLIGILFGLLVTYTGDMTWALAGGKDAETTVH